MTIVQKLPNIKVRCYSNGKEQLNPVQLVQLNKLAEDVLFYLFYNCPGEVYQLAAASELYCSH